MKYMAFLRNIFRVVSFLLLLSVAYIATYVFFRDQGVQMPAGTFADNILRQAAEGVKEVPTLPAPEGVKQQSFSWKYQGRDYRVSQTLYDSFYRFYASLPMGVPDDGRSELALREVGNAMFMTPAEGDDTIKQLAEALRKLGKEQRLTDDQTAELVVSFVQALPYDQGKLDRRTSGQDSAAEKIFYPYETLFLKTGVCQDKSYLAYMLLRELGYGVSIFLFPDPSDNHMAVGIKCPTKYANYGSSYCFVETTSLGNKIGMIPEIIPQSRVATSDIEITSVGDTLAEAAYQPLGHVEIMNEVTGSEYTGIVETIATQKEIERLKGTISANKQTIKTQKANIDAEQSALDEMLKKLKKLSAAGEYDAYNDLVKKYNKALSALKKDVATYNEKVAASNAMINKYNKLTRSFYRE
jgi:uncharacterized protein YukE